MRWPLRYQIMVPMAIVMILAVVFVESVGALLSVRDTESQINAQIQAVARIAAKANFPLTEAVLRQMKALSGAELVVTDDAGRVMAASDPSLEAAEFSIDNLHRARTEHFPSDRIRTGNRSYFHTVVTVANRDGNQRALLNILYPEADYDRAWQREVYPPIGFVVVALPVVLLLSIATASRIARRIAGLQRQVDQIAGGDFQQLELPRGDDEIRSLASAVNRMAAMLAGYEDKIRRTERMSTLAHLGGGIAHQLRNSATGCAMAVDLHAGECPLGATSENLAMAKRQLRLMEQYLQRFLQLGKPRETGDMQQVDLVSLLNDLMPLVEPSARHAGVDLSWSCGGADARITGDAERLGQMVINLAVNAIEAAAQNRARSGAPAEVSVDLSRPSPDRILLTFSDTGPGPTNRVQHTLFEPFVTDKPDGVGLGLSVAQEVAAQHGGQIAWQRASHRTVFTIELKGEGGHSGASSSVATSAAKLNSIPA